MLAASAFGQGTTPTLRTWTKSTQAAGYPIYTIAQFDRAAWISSRGCYALWGQYKSATFSEENDAMGCFDYAENRWNMLLQSSSIHTVHRPQTGHQWGYQEYVPATDTMYWISNSGAQGLEEMWALYRYDFGGMTSSAIPVFTVGATLTRPWINGAATLSAYMSWDSTNNLMVFFPDNNNQAGKFSLCTIGFGTTMTCTAYNPGSGPAATNATSALHFNPDDGYTYWLGGGATSFQRLNAASPGSGWTDLSSATCTGADCVITSGSIGHPPTRNAPGVAYTTTDHVFLVMGGMTGSTQYLDVWTFDPAGSSGAGAWNEICGPGMTACGTAGTSYPTLNTLKEGDRLVYNATDNVFMLADDGNGMWFYALSAATGNYGRTTPNYAPPVGVSPITGPLNRTAPPSSPANSNAQTGAFDLSIDSSGGAVYLSHVEPTVPTASGTCGFPVPYVWSSTASGNWLPTGTQAQACAAFGSSGTLNQPSGHPFHARVAGVDWVVNDRRNFSGFSSNGQTQAQTYNSGTGVWSGANIGCFTATCFSINSTLPQNYPVGLIDANGVPTVAMVEQQSTFNQRTDMFVAQWNGSAWVSLSGSTPLNVLSSAFVTYGSVASDPSGNLMTCWTEEVDSSGRITMTTTPQLRCKYWNGSAFSVIGGGSINQTAANWALSPSVAYAGGVWYVAYVEQSRAGVGELMVKSCPLTGSCSLIGSASLNNTATTGIPYHPSLSVDGSTLILAWEEQSAQGQHNLGYIKYWSGSAWVSIASGIAADTTNGSISDIGITVATAGTVTAAWTETTWGNLPQVYLAAYSTGTVTSSSIVSGKSVMSGMGARR